MNIDLARVIAENVSRERDEQRFVFEECPKCGTDSTMLKFHASEKENFGGDTEKYRCLNCLALFTKEFKSE